MTFRKLSRIVCILTIGASRASYHCFPVLGRYIAAGQPLLPLFPFLFPSTVATGEGLGVREIYLPVGLLSGRALLVEAMRDASCGV